MVVTLGARSAAPSLITLLTDCHARIRNFAAMAVALGEREELPAQEVREACEQCARYFSRSLPLHVADEEHSLTPRLAGTSAEVDDALAAMTLQHADHQGALVALLAALAVRAAAPQDAAPRAAVRHLALPLQAAFLEHLELEERVLFPAVRAWPAAIQREVLAELQARRT